MSPEARQGTGGGNSPVWRRFKYQVRRRCGEPRTKGGRETQVMGRQPDAEGAAKQMRKRRDRRHERGWLCTPPPGAENGPLLVPCRGGHNSPVIPVFLVHPGAPQGAPAFVQTPAGEGAQASKADQRAPESARRAPAPTPPSGCPLLPSAARSLFPPGARDRGGGPVPGGAQAGAALYLRVFVKQRQAFLGYFEALGQPFAQPFHGLVVGHRQVVAGPRGAVDG